MDLSPRGATTHAVDVVVRSDAALVVHVSRKCVGGVPCGDARTAAQYRCILDSSHRRGTATAHAVDVVV